MMISNNKQNNSTKFF